MSETCGLCNGSGRIEVHDEHRHELGPTATCPRCDGTGVSSDERAAEVLAEFVEWFDAVFPKGGKNLPGVTLYSIAEKARSALGATGMTNRVQQGVNQCP